jgi:hypothetical protein
MTLFHSTRIHATVFASALAAITAIGAGCSSSNNNPTPPATGGTAGIGNTGGSAGNTTTGGRGGGTATGGQGGSGNAGGSGGASCIDATDKNCFSCTPTTTNEFYNQCPTTGCTPFDNSTLTKLSLVPTPPAI